MLIDRFAAQFDASEYHEIAVKGAPDDVYRALWKADLGSSWILRALLLLRSGPKLLVRRQWPVTRRLDLEALIAAGFGKLAEAPGGEVVLGIMGRFWRPVDNAEPFDRSQFDGPVPPGLARAIWNWKVRAGRDGRSVLSTETRVVCGDRSSRWKFRLYWLVVRPFSGLIRRLMLGAVRRECG